jgi:hypothetical protein
LGEQLLTDNSENERMATIVEVTKNKPFWKEKVKIVNWKLNQKEKETLSIRTSSTS